MVRIQQVCEVTPPLALHSHVRRTPSTREPAFDHKARDLYSDFGASRQRLRWVDLLSATNFLIARVARNKRGRARWTLSMLQVLQCCCRRPRIPGRELPKENNPPVVAIVPAEVQQRHPHVVPGFEAASPLRNEPRDHLR